MALRRAAARCCQLQQQQYAAAAAAATAPPTTMITTAWPAQLQHHQHYHYHHHHHYELSSSSLSSSSSFSPPRHSTTILCVRRGREVVVIGDGQATQGDFVVKPNVRKVRRVGASAVGGFAGVAVDGLALLERLEQKLVEHPGQLRRAAVELAKMWRQDKLLRELAASLVVADRGATLLLMGNGDALEPGDDGVVGIGSGADFAEAAARALLELQQDGGVNGGGGGSGNGSDGSEQQSQPQQQQQEEGRPPRPGADLSLFEIAARSMTIAADSCVYTNHRFTWLHITPDGEIVEGSSSNEGGAEGSEGPSEAAAAASAGTAAPAAGGRE